MFFVSIRHPCAGREGELAMGKARGAAGEISDCLTLIICVAPYTVVDAVVVHVTNARNVVLDSDVLKLPAELAPAKEAGERTAAVFPVTMGSHDHCAVSASNAHVIM